MPSPAPKRWSALDLVEGLHLGHAVGALQGLGLLSSMTKATSSDRLSANHGLDPEVLRGLLEYVALRTDLIRKTRKGFITSAHCSRQARFLLDLYACAYAGNASHLATLLRTPAIAAASVDRIAHLRAFETAGPSAIGVTPAILRQLGFNYILDIGCGTAALLRDLAAHDKHFIGWGIDSNALMCKVARSEIRKAGLAQRVKVFTGDGKKPSPFLSVDVLSQVRTVTACQFVNELFRGGTMQAQQWLRRVRRLLPGRVLVIADYYGQLGNRVKTIHRETLLHDYVQLISGQGVPPPNVSAWRRLYRASECKLFHVIEDKTTTLFIHFIQM